MYNILLQGNSQACILKKLTLRKNELKGLISMSKTQVQKDYDHLLKLSKHTRLLQGILALLEWDHETYMPEEAVQNRAEQLKALEGIIHKAKTGKKFLKALSALIDVKTGKTVAGLSDEQSAALHEWRRDFLIDTALPSKFVENFIQLTSLAMTEWKKAKKENQFKIFAPFLEKIVKQCQRKAELIGYKEHPYDALLDLYEPAATVHQISPLFDQLRGHIKHLLGKIRSRPQVNDAFLKGDYSEAKQMELGNKLLETMGFSLKHGRLDLSAHPFSSAQHPSDSRVTTRIKPHSILNLVSTVLHEGGHSLYEMGLPEEHFGSPLGSSISLGMHESQSRWWETRIGHSKPFWNYYLPILQQEFAHLKPIDVETFYKAVNKVEPSLIRVEADEVTYPLHVIIRYELEKALIEGSLKVKDLPEAWNSKMQEYLGITPKNDAEGCLQDIHWATGSFGYFPTYSLGNLYAAHLFQGFEKDHPDWQKKASDGKFDFIKAWLSQHVYKHGKRYTSLELLEKATHTPFSPKAYLHYLDTKYQEIYGF